MQTFTEYGVAEDTAEGGRCYYASGYQLRRWASRPGMAWPCSDLARTREAGTVVAKVDARGDLVGLERDGDMLDVTSDELNAWIETLESLSVESMRTEWTPEQISASMPASLVIDVLGGGDVLDLRTLADEWSDEIDDGEVSRDYCSLCLELGCEPTPDGLRLHGDSYEPTLIAEDYFEDYAQELAEDIGAIPENASWPARCIDWEQAARELAMDYSLVSFDGSDYYIRS